MTAAVVLGVVAFVLAGAASWAARRQVSTGSAWLLPVAAGLSVAAAALELLGRSGVDWNSVRMAITVGLSRGMQIYYPAGEGPAWCQVYPPLGFLLYLPAATARTPIGAIHFGQALAALWVMVPMGVLAARAAGGDWGLRVFAFAAGVTVALAGAVALTPIGDFAFNVHVDGPGAGLALLACAVLAGRGELGWGALVASAALAAGAVATKQPFAPVPVALTVWVAVNWGGRRGGAFVGVGLVAFALLTLAAVAYFGARPLWYNLLHVPAAVPVAGTVGEALRDGVTSVVSYLWPLWTCAIGAGVSTLRAGGSWRERLRDPIAMLWLVALLELPLAVYGYMKFGAARNHLASCGIFLLGASVVWIARCLAGGDRRAEWTRWVPTALLLLAGVASAGALSSAPFRERAEEITQHERSFAAVQRAPGRFYFPWLPLTHLMGEEKAYHFSWGLLDRAMAGDGVAEQWLRAYVPGGAEVMLMDHRPDHLDVAYGRLQGDYPVPVAVDGFEGWSCFARARP